MKKLLIALFITLISCSQREEDVGSQSNPFDASGDNWTNSQAPIITLSGSDTLYWRHFNFTDSTGDVLLPITITDVDGEHDSITTTILLGLSAINLDTAEVIIVPEGILLSGITVNKSYYIKIIARDIKNSADTLDTLLFSPKGFPPAVPESLSIAANFSNISIDWSNKSINDTIIILKTNFLDSQFVKLSEIYDSTQANDYNNNYSLSYYLLGSKNEFGMNLSYDTLTVKAYSVENSINPNWNNTPAVNSITIQWYYYNSSEISYFEVCRSKHPVKSYRKIAEVGTQTNSDYTYTDYSISTTDDYYYKVSYILKNGGASSLSNYAKGYTIRLDSPTNLNLSKGTYGKNIHITWDPVFKAKYYGIYRCFQSDNYTYLDTILLDTSITSTQYLDTPPTDSTYIYAVYAIDSSNNKGAISWASSSGYTLKYAKNFMVDTNLINDSTISLRWDFQKSKYDNCISLIYKYSDSLFSDTTLDTIRNNYMYDISYKDSLIDTNYSTYFYQIAQLDTINNFLSKLSDIVSATAAPKPLYRDSIDIVYYPDSAVLLWNKVKGAENYLILLSPTNSTNKSNYTIIDTISDTTITITEFLDSSYYYTILPNNKTIMGNWLFEYGIKVEALSLPDSGIVFSTSTPAHIEIYFNEFNNATSYNLYRSTDSLNNYSLISTSDTNNFKDTVTTADKYFYKIKGVNLSGEGSFSNIVSGTRTKPGTTNNINATQGTLNVENIIHVTWDTITGADTVFILRAESNQYGNYSIIDTIAEHEYYDTVTVDSLFFYKVRGKNVAGFGNESTFSNGGFRKPSSIPDSVINVSTYSGYTDQIRISWGIPATGARSNGFIIYRLDNDSIVSNIEQHPLDTVEATGNSSYNYNDTSGNFTPVGFGKHWYIVKSYNILGISPPSEPVYGNIQ